MIVYHGSSMKMETPDVLHSYRSLDFGKGFYITTVEGQAAHWARRKADLFGGKAIVNCYQMSEELNDLNLKTFDDDLVEWIDFVCRCRDGETDYQQYDLIYGKVANDKVFRVVDLYRAGIWEKDRALREIKVYPNYDQYAFITQKAIEQLLKFDSFYEV
ncbi:MAG: DUF3990 domain-containing protein [Oscillospiraceae bacterium]|nr:DUF3990 domain-containing protein [Oscillospiraceae bacterium]